MIQWFICLFLSLSTIQSHAYENSNPHDVQVSVSSEDGHFKILASYEVPIDICTAYTFITDYEGAKYVPGIIESKVISRTRNRVRVQRLIREQILFFPIEMKSLIEYTEFPNKLITFNQISGDNKQYQGSWRLSETRDKTLFRYEAIFEPNSLIPYLVIEYFIRNSVRGRFEFMAQRAAQTKFPEILACN
ncbi:SRPBCC family protein [Polynucleobacter sp. MWH-Berg-3C6]|uniref:SRPBCC family protein n=1 Tax=Polynucleobacter sp. MWH-Berg-3C6 TaxID=1855882 RepID=UPI001C0D906A|nr:SRPBCC family protein [Polynucleobacter sp. MWH-Berg-3C6]MBU3550569.1 cyclase/dehydrase [Polynucleobacter sp. MWH-Berg-3C6]